MSAVACVEPVAVVVDPQAAAVAARRHLLGRLLNQEAARPGTPWLPMPTRRLRAADAAAAHELAVALGRLELAPTTVAGLQQLLAAAGRALSPVASRAPEQRVPIAAVPASLRAFAIPGFRQLVAAARAVHERTGARVLLHGSLASDDWTGYRDADLLLLVPTGVGTDAAALAALQRCCAPLLACLFRLDPLQHHGLFVLPEEELRRHPEHYLPVATLRRSLDLGGDGHQLAVRAQHDLAAARAELDWVVEYLANARPPRDAHGWKAYASVLMLLPALWASAAGQPCWKGDSFALAEPVVPSALWEPQRWAARLRAGWCDLTPTWLRWLLAVAPDPRLVARLARRWVPAPAGLLPPEPQQLLRAAHELAVHLRACLPAAGGGR